MAATTRRFKSSLLVPIVVAVVPYLVGLALLSKVYLPPHMRSLLLGYLRLDDPLLAPLSDVLGLLFVLGGLAMFAGSGSLLIGILLLDPVREMSSIVRGLAGTVSVSDTGRLTADLNALRLAIEEDIADQIREAEQRLKSEWRFVVVLITGTLIRALAVFVALFTALK